MGIFTNIQAFFRNKKQLKLDKAQKERESNFYAKVQKQIDSIVSNDSLTMEEKNMKLYTILTTNLEEASTLGVIEQKNINEFVACLKNYGGIAEAVRFNERKNSEDRICGRLSATSVDNVQLQKLIEEYIQQFYLQGDGVQSLELLNEKKRYDIICSIIGQKYADLEGMKQLALSRLNDVYKSSYQLKISQSSTPQEKIEAYNEYIIDFLGGDSEKIEEFRREHIPVDILRKIDCMNELGIATSFKTMDSIPLYYDMTKETVDESLNGEIAEEKLEGDMTPKDLLFIRTSNVFPRDGVVETIGKHSEPENIGNPFSTALKNINPEIKDEEMNVQSPRFRWTSHWCINAIVGNHAWGDFSGRDYFIIEDANEQANNKHIINRLVADVIHVGDMKLSKNAKIMMSIEKYKELLKDPQMKEQLAKIGVILYKGNPAEALKKYMNESGYVYGRMASTHYMAMHNEYVNEYLTKIVMGEIPGYEHCASMLDENLLMTHLTDSGTLKVFQETSRATRQMIGSDEEEDFYNKRTTINEMSASIDEHLSHCTFCKYIEYLADKFPQMGILLEAYKKAKENPKQEKAKFEQLSEKIIREIGIDNILACTKEFNEIIAEEQKIARAEKDKELLKSGMITQSEYDARTHGDGPIEKN